MNETFPMTGAPSAVGSALVARIETSFAKQAFMTTLGARLVRVEPGEAHAALEGGALMIDIRSESQRAADGVVPGTIWFARNVLEWRCDPACDTYDDRVGGLERHVIVMCDEGYQSSLAAATLQQLGFHRATDVEGGFQAWRAWRDGAT